MLTKKQLQLLEFIHKRLQQDGVPPSFDEMKTALDLRSKSGIHRLITALEERGFIHRLAHRARAIEVIRLPDSLAAGSAGIGDGQHLGARRAAAPAGLVSGGAHAAGSEAAVSPGGGTHSGALSAQDAGSGGVATIVQATATDLPVMGRIAAGVPIEAIGQVARHVAVPNGMLSSNGQHYALEVRGDSMIEAGINDGDVVVIRETDLADNGDIVVALVEGNEATLKRYYRMGNKIELEAANPAYPTRRYDSGQVQVQGRLVGLIRTY